MQELTNDIRMRNIQDFPAELLDNVASNVTPDDLPEFRKVCRSFATAAWRYFKGRFERIRVTLSRQRLDELLRIASHPHIVENVYILEFRLDEIENAEELHQTKVDMLSGAAVFRLDKFLEKLSRPPHTKFRLRQMDDRVVAQWMDVANGNVDFLTQYWQDDVLVSWLNTVVDTARVSGRSLDRLSIRKPRGDEIIFPFAVFMQPRNPITVPLQSLELQIDPDVHYPHLLPDFYHLWRYIHNFFLSFHGLSRVLIDIEIDRAEEEIFAKQAIIRAVFELRDLTACVINASNFTHIDLFIFARFCKHNSDTMQSLDLGTFHVQEHTIPHMIALFRFLRFETKITDIEMNYAWYDVVYDEPSEYDGFRAYGETRDKTLDEAITLFEARL